MEVTIKHRWGGHRGRRTEWEIECPDKWAFENFPRLPDNPAVWVPAVEGRYTYTLTLDEGAPAELALEIVAAIVAEYFERLRAVHLRVRPFHALHYVGVGAPDACMADLDCVLATGHKGLCEVCDKEVFGE
jgi:hypothetical protein